MYSYIICPDCGGVKWVQTPDYDHFQDSGTDAVPLKGCTCPPKPEHKPELTMTIACPHCGKHVTFEIKGDIKFDFGEREKL